jgi:hypothetical protein
VGAKTARRYLSALSALALLAGAVGCGSSSSSSSGEGSTATTAPARETTSPQRPSGAAANPNPANKAQSGSGAGGSGGSAKKPQPSIAAEEAAPGDHSIQEYGAEAQGSEKAAVLAAMRSFIAAMATGDYARLCAALPAANRAQMQQFAKAQHKGGGCAAVLARLLNPAAAVEAKKALGATIAKVRVGKGNAFVLFRPRGGRLSYFVMKEEGGEWRATSLGAGTPLRP